MLTLELKQHLFREFISQEIAAIPGALVSIAELEGNNGGKVLLI